MGRLRASTFVFLVLASGCRGGTSAEQARTPANAPEKAVDLELTAPDGRVFETASFHGQPTLLFLFATFDGVSQAALGPLEEFVEAHPEVRVVGVAVQPNPKLLVDAWQHALEPTFLITYDAEEEIGTGKTALGPLEGVPTFVMLDANGREVGRHVGMATRDDLASLREKLDG